MKRTRSTTPLAALLAMGFITATACHAMGQEEIVIAYFGDSTVFGLDPVGRKQLSRTAPLVLQEELSRRCHAPVKVVNYGRSGAQASDLLGGSKHYPEGFPTLLMASGADYTIVNYGINDAAHETAVEAYRNNLDALYDIARAVGVVLFYETPNPVIRDNPRVKPALAAHLPSYVHAMESVAASNKTLLIDQFSLLAATPRLSALIPDGIHPGEEMLAIKAKHVADRISPHVCPDA